MTTPVTTPVIYLDLLDDWGEAEVSEARRQPGVVVPTIRERIDEVTGPDEWLVCRRPQDIAAAVDVGCGAWLRGYEGGGEVPALTGLILLRAAVARGARFVVEGLGRRGMAASVVVGAAGVALTAHTWGLASSPLTSSARQAVLRARSGRDTEVFGELGGRRVRVLARGAAAAAVAGWRTNPEADVAPLVANLAGWWRRDEPTAIPAPQCIGESGRLAGAGSLVDLLRTVRTELTEDLGMVAVDSARADVLGCGRPVIQGPMANVAEGTSLAAAVRDAGGMPFFALGALDPVQADSMLASAAGAMKTSRWGVGLIGFEVMPFRDAHLDAIARHRPTAVIIAGGGVGLARRVQDLGCEAWLHTPSGRLAYDAMRAGVDGIVLEGHEAGGHVGALTSIGLWEEALQGIDAAAGGTRLVLAGGIGDAASAAFAFAMAAHAHRAGLHVAIQAGTAFMLTHDIVEGGQITPEYQRAAVAARDTVLVGSSVNLPLRCAPSPHTARTRRDELRLLREGVPRDQRRLQLERTNLGTTRIAAKGLERNPEGMPRYRDVSSAEQRERGAFTMGQGATVDDRLRTVAQTVAMLSDGAAALLGSSTSPSRWGQPSTVPGRPDPSRAPLAGPVVLKTVDNRAPIAIVGLGCTLPRAPSVPAFWANLVGGVDAIREIPDDRWSADRYWDPRAGPRGPAKTCAHIAGFVGELAFDPRAFRIPPRVAQTMDPAQRMALVAASQAVATWKSRDQVDGSRGGVVLGNAMGGEYSTSLALRVRAREVLDTLAEEPALAHLQPDDWSALARRVDDRLGARLPPLNMNSMSGLLANVIAGRVASWLDWHGGNMTVDAACASSLAAVGVAMDWLRSGRCDAVITGGVDADLSPETFVAFTLTGALSPTGSRPFSEHADGFVMGEGCAVFVLKRLDDALRDGDAVWAVLRGIGQSSDGKGRSITAPRPEGQRLAIRRAWSDAGLEPSTAGMIEAHGTGTTIGDRTEMAVLQEVFDGCEGPLWVGSVKSMVGHLKGAAGAAGLLKATLAVATGTVPPTLHAGPVDPRFDLTRTCMQLPRRPAWLTGSPRRAGVSAFGFGGTNVHLTLEQAPEAASRPAQLPAFVAQSPARPGTGVDAVAWPLSRPASAPAPTRPATRPGVYAWGADDLPTLVTTVAEGPSMDSGTVARHAHRLTMVAMPAGAEELRRRAADWLAEGAQGPAPGAIFLGDGKPGAVLLLVPGQGSQSLGATTRACRHPRVRSGVERCEAEIGSIAERLGLRLPATLRDMEKQRGVLTTDALRLHLLVFSISMAWGQAVQAAGIPVAATLGHSLGEYAALALAGAIDEDQALRVVAARGLALTRTPAGAMLAIRADEATARALAEEHGLAVAAVNGPTATVLSGPAPACAAARTAIARAGLACRPLDVAHAFHSPSIAPANADLRLALAGARFGPSSIPCFSAHTTRPFPAAPQRQLEGALLGTVNFATAVRNAVAHTGATLAIELGPGRALGSHAAAAAAGLSVVSLDAAGTADAAARAAAQLLAHGHDGLVGLIAEEGRRLGGTTATRATPTPRVGVGAHPLADRARAVQDLRIAALADASVQDRYEEARAALLAELARLDHGEDLSGALLPSPAAPPVAEHPSPAPIAPEPDGVRAQVIAAICEVTGYSSDALTPGVDLEGDLGIDSVRKLEILGQLQEQLGFTADEADYERLQHIDLEGLVAYVDTRVRDSGAPDATPAEPTALLYGRLWRADAATPPTDTALPTVPAGFSMHGSTAIWRAGPHLSDIVAATRAVVAAWLRWATEVSPRPERLVVVASDSPVDLAAAGFARALGREWGLPARVVHVEEGAPEDAVIAEAIGPRTVDARVSDLGIQTPMDLAAAPHRHVLPAEPFVVATGGATGIVAELLASLAGRSPRVLLLGRTDPQSPDGTRTKAALQRLRDSGIDLVYARCDVSDRDGVAAAIGTARERWGAVDVVLHGAGCLRDGRVADLQDADIDAVLGPKVAGAAYLVDATTDDGPAMFAVCSSIVAGTGNAGQTLYGAANLAMEAIRHPTAQRQVALRYTAWAEVGMASTSAMTAAMALAGITPLPVAAGRESFVPSLACGPVVTVAAQPLATHPAWPLTAASRVEDILHARIELSATDPAFDDHRVQGRPLVPASVWLAAMTRLAGLLIPEAPAWELSDFAVHAPTFVEAPRSADLWARPATTGWRLEIRVGGTAVAGALLEPADLREGDVPAGRLGEVAGLYRPDALFHGPRWQVLTGIGTASQRIEARVDPGPDAFAAGYEAVHQLASLWHAQHTGWLAIPRGAGRWWMRAAPPRGEIRVTVSGRAGAPDGCVSDATGPVLMACPVHLTRAAPWPEELGAGPAMEAEGA